MAVTQDSAPLRSTALRPGAPALVAEAVREAWSRRRLIRYLVQADLKKKGADTLLGNLWWILDPVLQMLVYVVLVTVVFQRSIPAYPLFIFAAILPWKWFTSSVGDAIVSVTSQERLIKQIQFPKIVLPFASTVAGLVNFGFGFIGLAALLIALYADRISATLVLLPVIAAVQFVFTLGITFLVAATNVFYRDLGNVSRHFLRLWFYLSPGLYSIDQVTHISKDAPWLGTLFSLNPFTILFEAYRAVIYSETTPDWGPLAALLGVSFILLVLSTWLFKRVEPAFAKIL
jgi:ABC-type polysaccharide/polyol phosphate export permease